MKIDYPKIMSKAFHFSYQPKRWIPFFFLDAIFGFFALFIFLNSSDAIMDIVTNSMAQPSDVGSTMLILNGMLYAGIVFVLWALVRIWISGAIIHQSHKEKESNKSWNISKNKLLPMIIATFLTSVIGMIGGFIPTVGWVVSLVLGWMFMFIIQAIIIDNLDSVESIKKSYHIFTKSPFDIFIIWLLVLIVSLSITFVFALPLIGSFIGSVVTMAVAESASTESLAFLTLALQENLLMSVGLGLVALVGISISSIFSLKAQTEFYLQATKKRLGR